MICPYNHFVVNSQGKCPQVNFNQIYIFKGANKQSKNTKKYIISRKHGNFVMAFIVKSSNETLRLPFSSPC